MGYLTYHHKAVPIRATEAVLDRVYDAAQMGLKGAALAYAAGLTPAAFNQLKVNDPLVEMAAEKGRVDAEMAHARKLYEASMSGDTKASLAILQHVHGWTAKQEIDINANHSVDIKSLLAERAARIYDNNTQEEVTDAE